MSEVNTASLVSRQHLAERARHAINQNFSIVEQGFNRLGIVLFVSSASGAMRSFLGTAQAIIAFVGAGISLFLGKGESFFFSLQHIKHGVANIIRGSIEATFLLNIVLSYFVDRNEKRMGYGEDEVKMPNMWHPNIPEKVTTRVSSPVSPSDE